MTDLDPDQTFYMAQSADISAHSNYSKKLTP